MKVTTNGSEEKAMAETDAEARDLRLGATQSSHLEEGSI